MRSARPGRGTRRRRLHRSHFERSHKSAICWEPAGSGGSFGTRGHGAKLTVNTNNQSARPIKRLAPAKRGGGAGGGVSLATGRRWRLGGGGDGDWERGTQGRGWGGLASRGWGFAPRDRDPGQGGSWSWGMRPRPRQGRCPIRARLGSTEVSYTQEHKVYGGSWSEGVGPY